MCGIFGDITVRGKQPAIGEAQAIALRDLLTHRGPDGAGLWRHENALLAHRRLAIIDPTQAGAQPMASADGRYVISYNGELYNDAELRTVLNTRGVRFRSHCDTETVLEMFAAFGVRMFERLRGMYAVAIYDTLGHTLTLARDPLGVKPLYYWVGADEVVFASEPTPIVAHPTVPMTPDWASVSAYCTTIRAVLGDRTLFEGVRAVRPGELVSIGFAAPAPVVRRTMFWRGPAESAPGADSLDEAGERLWDSLEGSVAAHLRSDVPVCALLSGGIDSVATSTIAASRLAHLRTYCAGAATDDPGDDLHEARLAAAAIGTDHAEAVITRAMFAERWPAMVAALGMPLSTPNEVAINAVAQRLRADGCVVTISGEGADELLAGYESSMDDSARFVRSGAVLDGRRLHGGEFQLLANAWIPPQAKRALFEERVFAAIDEDSMLVRFVRQEFDESVAEVGDGAPDELSSHLRCLRRMNLTGLLRRLDSATMLASVEGRTPFADRLVAEVCESMPMACKYEAPAEHGGGAAVLAPPRLRTKLALRCACAGRIPERHIHRPKASFPLPFQSWVADQAPMLRASAFAQEVFSPAAIEVVAADPSAHWRLAWPMCNIALWGDACFG
ncbi:MAG: asparagine synthase (glutamine-hydrolyzing) [Phycisphaeraceae bacterium]|nr:asparagine synthase (glutamine-hydrolyzing) [Phycisphaeraceae bacterium]